MSFRNRQIVKERWRGDADSIAKLVTEYLRQQGIRSVDNSFQVNKGIQVPFTVTTPSGQILIIRYETLGGEGSATATGAMTFSTIDISKTPIEEVGIFSTPWIVAGQQGQTFKAQIAMNVERTPAQSITDTQINLNPAAMLSFDWGKMLKTMGSLAMNVIPAIVNGVEVPRQQVAPEEIGKVAISPPVQLPVPAKYWSFTLGKQSANPLAPAQPTVGVNLYTEDTYNGRAIMSRTLNGKFLRLAK